MKCAIRITKNSSRTSNTTYDVWVPNITGYCQFKTIGGSWTFTEGGAITSSYPGIGGEGGYGSRSSGTGISFDANTNKSIYKNDVLTVQPQANQVLIIIKT